ncbi:MAG: DMT family transporter [Mogibacterium sp.]|nr:DMT family transporter [Mogibacterium sp.]
MDNSKSRLQLLFTMMLFGTIGTLSRYIDMPSSIICLGRAFLGAIIIIAALALRRERPDYSAIRCNIGWLILSSAFMCVNWICQFEAFKYTTIATSTLCYYMQPVFYILAAALILREKLSLKKIVCVAVAFMGMISVSGVLQTGFHLSELKGVIFAVSGGFFYAMVVLINKYMKGISTVDTTMMQLALVTVIMIPYSALTGAWQSAHITGTGLICLLILGFLHTGIAYIFYFDSVNKLSAQTVGILSYIDPVEAVLLSAFFLKEPVTVYTIAGAVMILGAAAVSELTGQGHIEESKDM